MLHVAGGTKCDFMLTEAQTKCPVLFHSIQTTNKMHCNVYGTFYSPYSHQHVSTAIAAIFRAMLLKEYKGSYVATESTNHICASHSCNNITLKMVAKAAKQVLENTVKKIPHKHCRAFYCLFTYCGSD